MKVKLVLSGVACSLALMAMTGCQTQAQGGAMVGSGLGCLAAMALEKNGKHRLEKCAVGMVAGGAAGYLIGRQRDLELARAAAEQIRATQPGMVAVQMRTTNLQVPPAEKAALNNASTVESLDAMIVSVPQPQIQRMDPMATATLSRVGKYVSDAQGNSKVTVSAQNPVDFDFIVASMKSGYGKTLPPQKVAYQFRPLNRGTQATVEVVPSNTNT